MASDTENNPSSCHLRGATRLARSDMDMKIMVPDEMAMDAHGTTFPLVIIQMPRAGYLPNARMERATRSN